MLGNSEIVCRVKFDLCVLNAAVCVLLVANCILWDLCVLAIVSTGQLDRCLTHPAGPSARQPHPVYGVA